MTTPIRVILVDDHPMVLQGIAACIEDAADIDLIAQAVDAESLLELPELQRCDVVILDINLPGMNGINALPLAIARNPDVRVLVFSMHRSVEYARKALAAGASGYVFKDAMPDELILAVQTVHRGGTYLPPETAAALATAPAEAPVSADMANLTERELEILRQVAAGQSSKGIAWGLGVSVRTVETHRRNIKQKLGAKSASECVSIAMVAGMIPQVRP
ncbi:MAG: response regulator transcription factor [Pseudomonadota bacterium]